MSLSKENNIKFFFITKIIKERENAILLIQKFWKSKYFLYKIK
jgi:hypothetical protein